LSPLDLRVGFSDENDVGQVVFALLMRVDIIIKCS
jgi:hypothetical protein